MVEWRSLPNWYGDCYEVSNTGLVRSLTRQIRVQGENNFRTIKSQVLKPRINQGGYEQVTLSKNRIAKTLLVHRLVCEAFNGPPPDDSKTWVLHGDGNRRNNTPENLRWGDVLDNAADTVRHGTSARWQSTKTHCPRGHPYSEENTYINPSRGSRSCRTCKTQHNRESWRRTHGKPIYD